jgi:hypothetical protein
MQAEPLVLHDAAHARARGVESARDQLHARRHAATWGRHGLEVPTGLLARPVRFRQSMIRRHRRVRPRLTRLIGIHRRPVRRSFAAAHEHHQERKNHHGPFRHAARTSVALNSRGAGGVSDRIAYRATTAKSSCASTRSRARGCCSAGSCGRLTATATMEIYHTDRQRRGGPPKPLNMSAMSIVL